TLRSPLFPYTTLFRSREEPALVTDRELHAVALAGNHHLVGVPERVRHRLLAQDRLRPPGCRRHGPRQVARVPQADGHDVEKPMRSEEHTSELQSLTNI